jgi:hypothetical protein
MTVFLQRALTRQSLRVWQRNPGLSRATLRTSVASLSSQAPLLSQLASESSSQSQNESRGIRALLAAGGLFLAGGVLQDQNRTDCCGIAGVVGASHHDARYVSVMSCFSVLELDEGSMNESLVSTCACCVFLTLAPSLASLCIFAGIFWWMV